MGEVRNQFTFYRSYYEALLPLPRENQAAILLAVCAYALYEAEPQDLTPVESAAFNLIRPTLDTARKKAQSGKKGGEGKGKQTGGKARRKEAESKPEAKHKQPASKPEATRKLEGEREGEGEGERERGGDREREGILYPPISPFSGQNGTETAVQVWNEVLALYPSDHLGDQMEAEAAYKMRVTTETDAHSMLTNLRLWKQSEQWNKDGGQFIPQLVNWISRGIWKTTPPKLITPKGASGELGLAEMEAIWKMYPEEEAAGMRKRWMAEHPEYSGAVI